jgi:hypothetical protein
MDEGAGLAAFRVLHRVDDLRLSSTITIRTTTSNGQCADVWTDLKDRGRAPSVPASLNSRLVHQKLLMVITHLFAAVSIRQQPVGVSLGSHYLFE